jgi:hypothetical protein
VAGAAVLHAVSATTLASNSVSNAGDVATATLHVTGTSALDAVSATALIADSMHVRGNTATDTISVTSTSALHDVTANALASNSISNAGNVATTTLTSNSVVCDGVRNTGEIRSRYLVVTDNAQLNNLNSNSIANAGNVGTATLNVAGTSTLHAVTSGSIVNAGDVSSHSVNAVQIGATSLNASGASTLQTVSAQVATLQHLEIGAGCSLTRNGFPVIQSGVSGGGVDTFQYSGGVSFNPPFERAPVVVATMLTRNQPHPEERLRGRNRRDVAGSFRLFQAIPADLGSQDLHVVVGHIRGIHVDSDGVAAMTDPAFRFWP